MFLILYLEGKVSAVVVEPAAEHEGEDVPDGLGAEDPLAGDGADAAGGQGGSDHALRLAGHLQGASLKGPKL